MSMLTLARAVAIILLLPAAAVAETLTVDEFRRELVGLPLCGTPMTGPLAGKSLCTVHLPDGTAILAGSGLLVRGVWDVEDGHICRRNAHEPPERRRCVDYERSDAEHYHNSDGVEFCIGPCLAAPAPAPAAAAAPPTPAAAASPASPPPAAAASAVPPPTGAESPKP
jgi:hypothetical protein